MKLQRLGKNISEVEILNVNLNGIWILVSGKEYFLDYKNYPWFQGAKIADIFNLKLIHQTHLYWPELDIDLDLDCLESPQKFPLIAKKTKTSHTRVNS
jgi:hypothetical protein